MGDIPIPAPAYTRGDYIYDEMKDLPWEDKYAGLYWGAGKTTGSFQDVLGQDLAQHHRRRFMTLANSLASEPHLYLRATDDGEAWQEHSAYVTKGPEYKVYFEFW